MIPKPRVCSIILKIVKIQPPSSKENSESREIYSREMKNIEIMANQATLSNLDNVSKFVIEIIPCEL